jgi:hypothetical protein
MRGFTENYCSNGFYVMRCRHDRVTCQFGDVVCPHSVAIRLSFWTI